jgi:flagellar motor switch protein FliG
MNITLENLVKLDESTIKAILDEISKNPSIVLPWYKTKSEILEL